MARRGRCQEAARLDRAVFFRQGARVPGPRTLRTLFLGLVVLLGCGVGGSADAAGEAPQHRLVFTGDILLSREVAHEIDARHGSSPWADLAGVLGHADLVLGNLEGTVG